MRRAVSPRDECDVARHRFVQIAQRHGRAVHANHERAFFVGDDAARVHGRHWRVGAPVALGLRGERGEVEAVHVVPKRNAVVEPLFVRQKRDSDVGDVGQDESPGAHERVARVHHGGQHAFEEQRVAHPLGDDAIHLLRDVLVRDLLHPRVDHLDDVFEAVVLDEPLGVPRDPGRVHGVHLPGAGSSCEHAQNPGTAPDVEHHFAFQLLGVTL